MVDQNIQYYVHQEPAIFNNIMNNYQQLFEKPVNEIADQPIESVTIYATGSSSNAAYCALPLMADVLKMPVFVEDPSYASNYLLEPDKNGLAIAISQGGHSYSTIQLVKRLQAAGKPVFTLTSDLKSPIAQVAQHILFMGMPIETMLYVSAGYSATILDLMLIANMIAEKRGIISAVDFKLHIQEIQHVVDQLPSVIELSETWSDLHYQELAQAKRCYFIGYGSSYGVAREGETKFTEAVRNTAFGKELEEYMHGPYLGLHPDDVIIFLDPVGRLHDRQEKLQRFLKEHVRKIWTIGANSVEAELNLKVECNELLASLFLTIPIHLAAFKASQFLGHDLHHSAYPDFDKITHSKI